MADGIHPTGHGRIPVVLITETVFAAINAALLIGLVETYGVIGAAYAFALTYSLYVIRMIWVGRVLLGFRWSRDVIRLLDYRHLGWSGSDCERTSRGRGFWDCRWWSPDCNWRDA